MGGLPLPGLESSERDVTSSPHAERFQECRCRRSRGRILTLRASAKSQGFPRQPGCLRVGRCSYRRCGRCQCCTLKGEGGSGAGAGGGGGGGYGIRSLRLIL